MTWCTSVGVPSLTVTVKLPPAGPLACTAGRVGEQTVGARSGSDGERIAGGAGAGRVVAGLVGAVAAVACAVAQRDEELSDLGDIRRPLVRCRSTRRAPVLTSSTCVHACGLGPPAGRNISTPRVVSVDGVVTRKLAVLAVTVPDTVEMSGGSKSVLLDQFTVNWALVMLRWTPLPVPGRVGGELTGNEHELLRLTARFDGGDDLLQPGRESGDVDVRFVDAWSHPPGLTAAYTGLKPGMSLELSCSMTAS